MSDAKYTVTFRMAHKGDVYDNPHDNLPEGTSFAGHLWYVLHRNGKMVRSAGFAPKESKPRYIGKITPLDEESYINSPASLTIQINKQQFELLNKFGDSSGGELGYNARAMGFDTTLYDGARNNCVSYVFKALELIGYPIGNFDPSLTFPVNAFYAIRANLAKYGAIEVNGNKLSPLFQIRSLVNQISPEPYVPAGNNRNYKITGYDGNSDEIHGGDGNDILIGKGGDDELYGGRGNDVLYGDYATDSASSSSSSSTFSTGYTADNNRTFSTSSDSSSSASSSSNESSSSSGNNDILNGGAGNDILNGGKGYDKYYIGDKDVIIDSDGVGEIHFLRKDYQMKTAEDLKKENERGIHIPRFNPQGLPPEQVFRRLYDLHFDFGNDNPNGETDKLFGFLEKVDDGNGSALFTLKDSAEKVIYYFDVEQPRMVDVKKIDKTAFKPYVSTFYWNGLQSRVMTAKRLTITEADTGHKVVINNFINGMLNIGLTDVEVYDGTHSRIYRNQARQNSGGGWGGNHQAGVRGQGTDMDSGSGNSSGNSSGSDNSTGTGNRNHGGNPDRSSPNPNRPSPNQGGRHYEVYDPLVLDLDGDGLETLSADDHRGALFDHDGDGIRTATGWLKADDGFLVYDRNNDGKINDLTELFSERFASNTPHGFAALSSLDSNHDGKVDALDEQFSRLKVWRDLNEDGQSSPEELFTLSQLNIRALYTHFEAQDQWQGGNHLTHLGQYETEEGHLHAMGDINFGYQPFYSQFIDKLTLTEEQKAAINLPGVGNVRDLREAATLSPKLAELLSRYRNVTTKAEQQALLPELIEAWAKTGKGYQTYGKALAKTTEYSLPTGGNGGHSDSLSTNDDIQILRVTPRELENIRQAKHDPAVMQRFEANKHKIATLNTLYHLNIQQLYYTTDGDIDYITDKVNRMYEQTLELAYRSLLSQTRLAPYFEHLTAVSQGTTPKTAEKLIALFEAKFKQSPEAALTDLAEFLSLLPQPRAWAEGLVLLQRYTAYAKAQGIYAAWQRDNQATLNVLTDIGFRFGSEGTNAADVFISHDESRTVKGEDGDDTFIGGKGNDVLNGSYGADTYIFAKGHGQDVISEYDTYQSGKQDTLRFTDVNYTDVRFRRENNDLILFGYHGDDRITIRSFYNNDYYQIENFQFADRTLSLEDMRREGINFVGTEGDDELTDAHDENEVSFFTGGKGNDVLDGSYGADTYIFAKGHGQDVISEYDTYQSGKQDTLRFTDVNYNDVRFRRENNDLILFGYHGDDRITIRSFYNNDYYQIENFQFADRTLSLDELKTIGIPLMGTDGDDEIQDWDSNAVIHGGDGNDRIYAHDGDDTLIGGKGNDVLNGSYGADTYIFAKGHGQDVISEYDTYQSGKQDTLRFTDVNYTDVRFRRENNDLILFGYHGDDRITIRSFYNNDYYQIENFQFADRTLSLEDMRREGINFVGTEGDDELTDAHDENEVSFFTGGKGNDVLDGSYGADTYIFAKGHGQDVISEYDTYQSGKQDTLRFTDVNYNDVRFRRENNDLILFGYHGDDRITIRSFYNNDYYQIENFQFADRTLSLAELKTIGMPLMGTDGDDEIQDWDSNAVIHGGDGNDRIYAHDGDDTLIGGKGNDVLDGSYGADTYIFAKGHGQDVISEYDTYQSGKQDTLRFTDVNYSDVRFRRENNDLILFGYHGDDRITIRNFYNNDYYQIENFQFADRTLSLEDMRREGINFVGTEGDDELTDAHDENEVSFFTGGKGNDVLDGSYGADTYIFAKGHGQDVISEYDTYQSGKQDTLRFTDVNYTDVRFRRENNDLILFGYHGDDRITIRSFYNNDYYQIENFQFADRTLSLDELKTIGIPLMGTDGDDEIQDWDSNAVIHGGDGNDRIYAHDGDDTLIGGKGNDVLDGSYGADTYIFAKGHGQDVISEYDTYQSGKRDRILFEHINRPDELWFSRQGDDLTIKEWHGEESLTIKDWYAHEYYQVEQIQLADGKSLNLSQLDKLIEAMAGFEREHSGDITRMASNEVQTYLDKIAVSSYWG